MSYLVKLPAEAVTFNCESGQSVLDAALAQGIVMSYGCRNGQCGSCRGQLLGGSIEYPDGLPDGITQDESDSGDALFCKAVPTSDLEIAVQVVKPPQDIEVKTLPVKVASMDALTDDVMRLKLQLPVMETFNFKAGQWVYFVLSDGRKRAFSLANAPEDNNQLELQIRHAVGGVFTDFVFNKLKVGDLLRIEGPHGTFWHQQESRPTLLVAGGTGFAPIKGIFEDLIEQSWSQPVHLFWGARGVKDLYQHELARQWQQQNGLDYTPVLSDSDGSDAWTGETGFVHESVISHYPDLSEHAVYMAGPPQMIESCKAAFLEAGLAPERLYYDSFEYSTDARDAMSVASG